MATIIIITPPKKPPVQQQGGVVGPVNVPGVAFEVPDDLSPGDALRYIADQVDGAA